MADDARSLPNSALLETSFLYGANAKFVEEMHEKYLNDPNSVGLSINGTIEDGMAQMSAKFKQMGSSVYLDADKVKESNKVL